jgi:hypothetical protein
MCVVCALLAPFSPPEQWVMIVWHCLVSIVSSCDGLFIYLFIKGVFNTRNTNTVAKKVPNLYRPIYLCIFSI